MSDKTTIPGHNLLIKFLAENDWILEDHPNDELQCFNGQWTLVSSDEFTHWTLMKHTANRARLLEAKMEFSGLTGSEIIAVLRALVK